MNKFGKSLRKKSYARLEAALSAARANGDAERVSACEAELKRRETPYRVPTRFTPMVPIADLDAAIEQWAPVPLAEFAGRYQVSSFGRVRGPRGKIIATRLAPGQRYVFVSLYRGKDAGRPMTLRLHRLVAGAFVANPEDLPEVNHKDSDRANNHAVNLEWVTREENIAHANESGRNVAKGNPNKIRKLKPEDVATIRAEFLSHRKGRPGNLGALAKRFDVNPITIHRIVSGKSWRDASAGARPTPVTHDEDGARK